MSDEIEIILVEIPTQPEVISLQTPGPKGDIGSPGDLMPADSGTWTGNVSLATLTPPQMLNRTLAGNTTITAVPADQTATVSGTISISIKQASTGGPYTLTWPTTLKWPEGAVAPTMPTVANAELIVHFLWTGTSWRPAVQGVYFQ